MIDVVVFTTEGREHLLLSTSFQLKRVVNRSEFRLLLLIDGQINPAVVKSVAPDLVVTNWCRRGYIQSILNALDVVKSDVFLWMEDDWDISRIDALSVHRAISFLRSGENRLQVRWSKIAPLEEAAVHIQDDFYSSGVGFSANPCVCRLDLVRAGFQHIIRSPKKGNALGVDGFENVISDWACDNRYVCAVFDPGPQPSIEHLGEIESTGRKWHMTQSTETLPSGYGYLGASPPFWRRLWMIAKLGKQFGNISWRQLFDDAYYDLAFRVAIARRKS